MTERVAGEPSIVHEHRDLSRSAIDRPDRDQTLTPGATAEAGQTGSGAPTANAIPPPPPGVGMRWLTYLVFDPLIILLTSFFGCISLVASLWDLTGRQQHAIARLWARSLLFVTMSPVTVRDLERLRGVGTAVYVSNHLSYMDTPVLFANLPFQFRIFAKQGLWKLPFIGWHLQRSGQVPVDQTTARNSVASLNRGVATLREGMPLVLFPEGGRSPTGAPKEFLPGAAFMALRAQVPLIPITLVGTYELLPMHVYALRPRPLELIVGEPISTAGMTTRDAAALTQLAYDAMTRTYMDSSERTASA